jgi:hypothetical protein
VQALALGSRRAEASVGQGRGPKGARRVEELEAGSRQADCQKLGNLGG